MVVSVTLIENKILWGHHVVKFLSGAFYFKPPSTLCSKKSDAKIEITITTPNLIRIKHPLRNFNYWLSGANVANFNKIHRTVSEQQPFRQWNSKTEVFNLENTN